MRTPTAHWPRTWTLAALAALVALALGAALWIGFTGRDGSLERVQRSGVLRVGYSVEAPFAVVGPDGAVGGQSAECAAQVARALGLRVEWVQTALDREIPDLLAGRFDMVGAGLFVTPERAVQVRFSVPTLRVRPAWLTRADSPAPTLQGLRSGWNVAVIDGSAADRYLASLRLGDHLNRVPDATTGVAGLRRGLYDVFALPWPVGRSLAAGHAAELAVWAANDGRPEREVALAFRPADRALAAAADAALTPWLQSAEYRESLARLGLTLDDLPARRVADAR